MLDKRATRRRRGGLGAVLLGAVVLSAALAGTAGAQGQAPSVRFDATSGTVVEGVVTGDSTFFVRVTRSARTVAPVSYATTPTDPSTAGFTVTAPPTAGVTECAGVSQCIAFNPLNQAILTITQAAETSPENWIDERLVMALRAPAGTVIGGDLVLTADDAQAPPTASFSLASIRVTEKSRRSTDVRVGVPPGTSAAATPTGLAGYDDSQGGNRLQIRVDPPHGIGTLNPDGTIRPGLVTLTMGAAGNGLGSTLGTHIVPAANTPGVFTLPLDVATAVASPAAPRRLTVTANPDMSGFRNPMITIAFVETPVTTSSGTVRHGNLRAGPPLVVEVVSDEAAPTVRFFPTDVSIREGGRTTVAVISEGEWGAEVDTVKLLPEGDALIDLYQGDTKLEPAADGLLTVDLTATNAAWLSARSLSDRALVDGRMKRKTWQITDAHGALLDRNTDTLTVTVEGATAVPALPLLPQLVLALVLTAAGARRSHGR